MWIKRLEERQAGVNILKREKLVWGLEERKVGMGLNKRKVGARLEGGIED